jgi:hypothetical protein
VAVRSRLLMLSFVLCSIIVACDDQGDEIGTPCESEEDCSDALVCDLHDGQGTCQHEHGH